MPARKNEVPPPAKAKPRKSLTKRKPNDPAPVPNVRDNQVQGRDGG